ncbi:MAG: Uncharacterized protein AWU57_473 [Marinobacter sp. T13-3]|nr:MAG: Uncharacterized protein AWU57_473 [Marinobacter sp. T13-3]
MQRLKKNQRNGCDYCRKDGIKTPGVWRSHGFYEVACDAHKAQLQADEDRREQRESRMTEADHQTWGRV